MLKRKIPLLMIFILLLSVRGGAAQAQSGDALGSVAQALSRNDFSAARAATQGDAPDGLATALYTWKFFQDDRNVAGNAGLLAQFIRTHADWPRMERLRASLEKNLSYDKPPREVTAWFDDFAPVSNAGRLLYLDALLMQGRQTDVQQHANAWWAEELMSRDEQKEFYNKYASFLTTSAHRKRLDMLLYKEAYGAATAVADVLGGGYPALAAARIALAQDSANAPALVAAVPSALSTDSGLHFERLRWRRRHDQNIGAMELLDNVPDVSGLPNADLWWKERHIIARRLMEEGQFKTAYLLVSQHVQKEGVPFAEAEFLSGWLALRFLNEPQKALQHFRRLEAGVKTPMSKTRADYWAGRAAKAMGDNVTAQGFFHKAALHQSLFYGQLAGAEIGLKSALSNAAPPILSAQDKAAMMQDSFIRVATAFAAAQDEDDARVFLRHFVSRNETAKAYMFAAQMAADMGYRNEALKIAKQASGDGLFLMAQAYPLITGEMQNIPTEWALVHAIIRQESMFDPYARSPAGALGLMQLMPGTASDTARKLGLAHDASWLTTRPSYNIRLGSQYLQDMVQRFGGSYPLAIAAYNAGPRRVDGWLETFGDPRTGQLELVDWIELIPISETRNYVQRVLEGVYAYRLRLLNTQPAPHAGIHVAMK